jgi:hypothetical protein
MTEQEIIEQLRKGTPFEGLSDISIVETQLAPPMGARFTDPSSRPDVVLRLDFAGVFMTVYGEVKTQVTPKLLKQIGPWLARVKTLNPAETYALICPFLSPISQQYCQENMIDFIDLSGNVLLRFPSKILIQRLNRPNIYRERQRFRNPFGGASSRVVRVLLQFPSRAWTGTAIGKELNQESERQNRGKEFQLSVSSISKTIQSLEEELLIRRDALQIVVLEPRQLLFRWADKYRDHYKWARRSSWTSKNPFGFDVQSSIKGFQSQFEDLDFAVTGAAAANLIAPFVNIDRIDVFISQKSSSEALRALNTEPSVGPDFLFTYPYDSGVFMYARKINDLPVVSNIQAYLDCYARGGRDMKQADYLLSNVIEEQWNRI